MKWMSAFHLLGFCSLAFSYHLEEFEMNLEEEWDSFKTTYDRNFVSDEDEINLDKEWDSFKTTYGRNFVSDEDEIMRKKIFEENLLTILMHNMRYSTGLETFELGVNQFSDMTLQEFQRTMLMRIEPENFQGNYSTFVRPIPPCEIPKEVDWRKNNIVTPVKSQGFRCRSCWAFSATGSIEGQHARKTGKLVSLSEQNLVDCSGKQGNYGCEGGWVDKSFNYVITASGIDREESYPYVAKEQQCRFDRNSIGAKITGYASFTKDEQTLKNAVACVGPVSVHVDAGHESFKSYKKGIYFEPACTTNNLNHAVLVVGYGTENGKDYWIIKNSWDTSWGEDGYMRMERNRNNQCGIASYPLYPLV